MKIRASTPVAALLDAHPEIEELLKWYDVELDDEELIMTLSELCEAYSLDLEDLLVEIQATMEDDDEDEDDDDPMDSFWRELEESELDDNDDFGEPDLEEPDVDVPAAAPGHLRST